MFKLSKDYKETAKAIYEGVGGHKNIASIDNCSTRVRIEIKDIDKVKIEKIIKAGAKEVLITGEDYIQVVVGPNKIQEITDAVKLLYLEKK
ncbi:PTS transporter subunit EIIB [Oceanivirga salmonicida]|uniref:PTS transporter subunit EIIB n=1 Tax=Oceanivirga salmonicida TaxID=1769291 RepID=UPI00082D9003|nr:PTS transporter subunit EIIB [Oceanivirga salmonicida]